MPQDAFAALQDRSGFRVSGDRLGSSSKNCALVGGAVYGASSVSQDPAHFPEPKGNKRRRADSGPKPREPQGIRCAYRHRVVHLLSAQRAPAFLDGQHSRFWLCGVTFLLKCAASSPKCILFHWKRRGSYGRIKLNYIVLLGRPKRGTEDVYCHLRRPGKGTGGPGKPAVCLAEGAPTPVRVKIFRNAVDLLDAARRENFTLYLLDVLMPGMNGMVAAKEIRQFDAAAALVFLTATPTFAYESYSVHALEYLLKPISPKTLYPILDQLYLGEQRPQDGLTVKGGKVLFRIPFSQLAYVEVNHKHLYFNLTDGSVREVAGVLKQYEDQLLAREEFMRIHRSYIVNMLQIETFAPTEVRTFSGKFLPISRLIYPQLQKDYLALLFKDRRNPEESIK